MVNLGLGDGGIRHQEHFSPRCNRSGIANPGSHVSHHLRALECKVLREQTIVPMVLRVGVAKFLYTCNSLGDNVLRTSQLCVYRSDKIPQQVLDLATYLSR